MQSFSFTRSLIYYLFNSTIFTSDTRYIFPKSIAKLSCLAIEKQDLMSINYLQFRLLITRAYSCKTKGNIHLKNKYGDKVDER